MPNKLGSQKGLTFTQIPQHSVEGMRRVINYLDQRWREGERERERTNQKWKGKRRGKVQGKKAKRG